MWCSTMMILRLFRSNGLCHLHSNSSYATAVATHLSQRNLLPTFKCASIWPDRIALSDEYGNYTYRSLLNSSRILSKDITSTLDASQQGRVAFLCPNNAFYLITQWACWISGHIAVPLSVAHPTAMLEYFLKDCNANIVITTSNYKEKLKAISRELGCRLIVLDDALCQSAIIGKTSAEKPTSLKAGLNPIEYKQQNALIIYTSGSTAAPKGVVLSHQNIFAQVNALISAWEWSINDVILHALPLHHVHGIINALICPLQCGARCIMLPKFDAKLVWDYLLNTKNEKMDIRPNIFMGVPTMYAKLIDEYDRSFAHNPRLVNYIKATCSQKIRLMVSGSAPLSEPVFYRWKQITGHSLLERYGMSEIGMALSNPLHGERFPGFVGTPLPGVSVRIMDGDNILVEGNEKVSRIVKSTIGPPEMANIGELQVQGENVFKEYWRKPEATAKEFTSDGWFKTGDSAQYLNNKYKILGRISVDIIKSGGYKISAIFVETSLLQHPDIIDVAVFGLPDTTWGQKVAAVVVTANNKAVSLPTIKEWAREIMPSYTIPTILKIVPEIKRNLMGKVNKKELVKELFNVKL